MEGYTLSLHILRDRNLNLRDVLGYHCGKNEDFSIRAITLYAAIFRE